MIALRLFGRLFLLCLGILSAGLMSAWAWGQQQAAPMLAHLSAPRGRLAASASVVLGWRVRLLDVWTGVSLEAMPAETDASAYLLNWDSLPLLLYGDESASSAALRALPAYAPASALPVLPNNLREFRPSPDGAWIAYSAPALSGAEDVWLRDARGERRLSNTPDQWESALAWSPDSRYLAYLVYEPQSFSLRVYELESQQTRTLFSTTDILDRPDWSTSGALLVLKGNLATSAEALIWQDLRRLPQRLSAPAWILPTQTDWSPDGERIAFSVARDYSLWVFDLRQQTTERLASPYPQLEPRWSPDGQYLAWVEWQDSQQPIVLLDWHQRQTRRLFVPPASTNYAIVWRP